MLASRSLGFIFVYLQATTKTQVSPNAWNVKNLVIFFFNLYWLRIAHIPKTIATLQVIHFNNEIWHSVFQASIHIRYGGYDSWVKRRYRDLKLRRVKSFLSSLSRLKTQQGSKSFCDWYSLQHATKSAHQLVLFFAFISAWLLQWLHHSN